MATDGDSLLRDVEDGLLILLIHVDDVERRIGGRFKEERARPAPWFCL